MNNTTDLLSICIDCTLIFDFSHRSKNVAADEQRGVSHQYFAHQGSLDDPRHIFVCYGRLRRHTFFSTAAAATLTIHLGPRVNNAISYIIRLVFENIHEQIRLEIF